MIWFSAARSKSRTTSNMLQARICQSQRMKSTPSSSWRLSTMPFRLLRTTSRISGKDLASINSNSSANIYSLLLRKKAIKSSWKSTRRAEINRKDKWGINSSMSAMFLKIFSKIMGRSKRNKNVMLNSWNKFGVKLMKEYKSWEKKGHGPWSKKYQRRLSLSTSRKWRVSNLILGTLQF